MRGGNNVNQIIPQCKAEYPTMTINLATNEAYSTLSGCYLDHIGKNSLTYLPESVYAYEHEKRYETQAQESQTSGTTQSKGGTGPGSDLCAKSGIL